MRERESERVIGKYLQNKARVGSEGVYTVCTQSGARVTARERGGTGGALSDTEGGVEGNASASLSFQTRPCSVYRVTHTTSIKASVDICSSTGSTTVY